MVEPNLIISTAKTVAEGVLEFLKTRPSYEQKQFEKLFDLEKALAEEATRDDADFDQVLHLRQIKEIFFDTVINEIQKSMKGS